MVQPTKQAMDDLVDRKLAVCKSKNGYHLYKFHNKVFYKRLWNESDYLLECRGIVFDDDGKIVQRPFSKVFNFGENNTFIHRDKKVIATRKINGFMAAATFENGELFVTTTGSFDSPYQKLAYEAIKNLNTKYIFRKITYIFEICDPSDPHIVDEQPGVYLIGMRIKKTGEYFSKFEMMLSSLQLGCSYPSIFDDYNFDQIKKLSNKVNHEGFMVYDVEKGNPIVKLKSPHYLSKKAMMRVGNAKADLIFDRPNEFKKQIDEEFYDVHDKILNQFTKEQWKLLNEQQCKQFIEKFYYG